MDSAALEKAKKGATKEDSLSLRLLERALANIPLELDDHQTA